MAWALKARAIGATSSALVTDTSFRSYLPLLAAPKTGGGALPPLEKQKPLPLVPAGEKLKPTATADCAEPNAADTVGGHGGAANGEGDPPTNGVGVAEPDADEVEQACSAFSFPQPAGGEAGNAPSSGPLDEIATAEVIPMN